MRLKLTENLKFNTHIDAARQRDNSSMSDHDSVVEEKGPLQLQLSHVSEDITDVEEAEEEDGQEDEDEGQAR